MMNVLSLFSGIGGFDLGLQRTGGFRTVALCETDAFCRKVLARHWPDVPILGDVTQIEAFPEVDVVVGGFPCQDVSQAGKRAGITASRSGLYRELVRAIRMVRPRYAIMENVAALLGNGLGVVLGDLAESGLDAEWDCVPASAIGAPHERDRIWIIAHSNDHELRESQWWSQSVRWRRVKSGQGEASWSNADAAQQNDRRGHGAPRVGQECESRGRAGATHFADAESRRCGSWGARRLPDSFAWIRDEARRNATNPYGARLAFGESFGRDARSEQSSSERGSEWIVEQSIWPREPALLGMDDGVPARLDRTKALGNTLIPRISELIGLAILDSGAAQ